MDGEKKILFYSGEQLGALRHGDIKAHFQPGASGGLPKMEAYNTDAILEKNMVSSIHTCGLSRRS